MKPGVTFFGEHLSDSVRRCLEVDRDKVDALIVMGTSLSVAPISKVVGFLPPNIPRILINRTVVHPSQTPDSNPEAAGTGSATSDFRDSYVFDAYLLGFCDDVSRALARRLFSSSTAEASAAHPDDAPDGVDRDDREDEGALLSCLKDDETNERYRKKDWTESKISSKIPPERIFLFPGAVPPSSTDGDYCGGGGGGDDDDDDDDDNGALLSVPTYREIAHCDGCAHRITEGTIHKCSVCFDYDLCQPCFVRLAHLHCGGNHLFVPEAVATGSVGDEC
jgi:hypothetical protein